MKFHKKIIIYIKNKIFIINVDHDQIIIFFENVNYIISNVFNFQVLNCKIYIYVLKIILRYKFDDRS